MFDAVKHLYKEGGLCSVFHGSVVAVLCDGPGSAACVILVDPGCSIKFIFTHRYFAAYKVTKKLLTLAGFSLSDLNLSTVIIAGGTFIS